MVRLLKMHTGKMHAVASDHICMRDPLLAQSAMLDGTKELLHQLFSESEKGFACLKGQLVDFSHYFGLTNNFGLIKTNVSPYETCLTSFPNHWCSKATN